jgi:vacuolar-type H+-ATPase subunit F/Vma7
MPAEMPGRIAVVGRQDVVTPFRAAGLETVAANPGPEAVEAVQRLVDAGFHVVFFTEDLFASLAGQLERYRRSAVPCLVPLPVGDARAGAARLREIVRKAVGADVFSQGAAAPGKGDS